MNRQNEGHGLVSDSTDTTAATSYGVMLVVRGARIESKPRVHNYCMVSECTLSPKRMLTEILRILAGSRVYIGDIPCRRSGTRKPTETLCVQSAHSARLFRRD